MASRGRASLRTTNTVQVGKDFYNVPKDPESGVLLLSIQMPKLSFEDIILPIDLKKDIDWILSDFKAEHEISKRNIKLPRKLLFYGLPGTGKSMTAEAMAKDLGKIIAKVNLDSIISSLMGRTGINLRLIFEFIRKYDSILLIDEVDSIAHDRSIQNDHGEVRRLVNSFLQMLDYHEPKGLIIATTNHQVILDTAVWRRFDEILRFDVLGREDTRLLILKLIGSRIQHLEIESLIDVLQNSSGDEIFKFCNDLTRARVKGRREQIKKEDFDIALRRQNQRLEARKYALYKKDS